MRSMKNTTKGKTRAAAFIAVFALILCAVLSFVFIRLDSNKSVSAADAEDVRFVQVAAGDGFAIGLTYKGDLYGWSTKSDNTATDLDAGADELAYYYPATPTKINYSLTVSGDYIKQIATTRYTAAFVTNNGYVFTWGKDDGNFADVTHLNAVKHRLLLRDPDTNKEWYKPTSVAYADNAEGTNGYYPSTAFGQFKPSNIALGTATLAGGEYNYNIVYTGKSGIPEQAGKICSFAWGSLLYGASTVETKSGDAFRFYGTDNNNGLYDADATRKIYISEYVATHGDGVKANAVAGGYTVGLNLYMGSIYNGKGGTTLSIRGKNFISTKNMSVPSGTYNATANNITSVTSESKNTDIKIGQDASSNDWTLTGGIAGNNKARTSDIFIYPNTGAGATDEDYFARQQSATQLLYPANGSVALVGSNGKEITEGVKSSSIQTTVSLGNDIGYGITGDGLLYFWGDNALGQSGLTGGNANYPTPERVTAVGSTTDKAVAVAAGRQVSASKQVGILNRAFTSGTLTDSLTADGGEYEFNESVKNDKEFITGAVTASGKLYLWGNYKYNNGTGTDEAPNYTYEAFSAQQVSLGKTKFIAVYSGYGNNIFAVTEYGRVVKYSFAHDAANNKAIAVPTLYDEFKSGAETISGWEVSAATDNTLYFTVKSSATDVTPELGSATFYVDSVYSESENVYLNTTDNKPDLTEGSEKKVLNYKQQNLVTKNGINDVYRILDWNKDATENSTVSFTRATSYKGTDDDWKNSLDAETLKPKFYFNGNETPMSETQIKNMFDYDIVYDSVAGDVTYGRVGLKITPKQSSKGGTVRAEFYVARYDSYRAFTGTGATPDNAVYYDYKTCSVQFKIDNTPTYQVIKNFDETSLKSLIPLLDPNNKYNDAYSIAVMDVTTGSAKLAEYLKGAPFASEADADADALVIAIRDAMKTQDEEGYPASSKIKAGNLNYYLDNPNNYYNDKYMHIFEDRDADMINISRVYWSGVNTNRDVINATREPIGLSINLSSHGIAADKKDIATLYKEFDNRYGFYGFAYDATTETLTFKYDVVRLTAKGATGNLAYETTNDMTSVKGYKATQADSPYVSVDLEIMEMATFNKDFVPEQTKFNTVSGRNVAAVYSQPSLRLNTLKTGEEVVVGSHEISADPECEDTTNKYTVDWTSTITVGETVRIKLSEYINTNGADIHFSYEDGYTVDGSYANFNKQFVDTDDGRTNQTVELTRDSRDGDVIIIHPVTTHNIYFTLGIQRFHDGGKPFKGNGYTDEKVEITFNFTNFRDIELEAVRDTFSTPLYISTPQTLDILGGPNNAPICNLRYADKSQITISELRSSDESILKVSPGADPTTQILVQPIASGTVSVRFVVTVYDKSILCTFEKVNVSAVTTIKDVIELIDVKYVYVNTMLNELAKANEFNTEIGLNYGILYNDNYVNDQGITVYNAIYFTNQDGSPATDKNGNPIDYPHYVKSVSFVNTDEANPRMRIELDNDESDTSGTYQLRVRYVDTTKGYESYAAAAEANAPILETSELIRSTKLIVPGDDGSLYTINVDCDNLKPQVNESNTDWYSDEVDDNIKVYIPIQHLLGKTKVESPEAYSIFLVSSSDEAANYFNYSFNKNNQVVITPLFNTDNPIAVNVSVKPTTSTGGDTSNQVVSFRVSVSGISTTLSKKEYTTIWLVAFFSSLGFLMIIFIIRLIVYWKRRAKQRALIKRNQELIRMRDRMHNKSTALTRQQIVKTKMKMEDPRYAKMLNEMRKTQKGQTLDSTGVQVESMSAPGAADNKKGKKKKGGKKSIAELKAELEAKKAAFAQAQSGAEQGAQGDFGMGGDFGGAQAGGDYGMGGNYGGDQSMDVDSVVFDSSDFDGTTQG